MFKWSNSLEVLYFLTNSLFIFQRQVCIGAVQCPFLADVYPCHPGPPVLPARPLGCTDPNVQCHPEHALGVGVGVTFTFSVPTLPPSGHQRAAELCCCFGTPAK